MVAREDFDARSSRNLTDERIEDAGPCEELRSLRCDAGECRHPTDGLVTLDAALAFDGSLEVGPLGPTRQTIFFLDAHPCTLILDELQGFAACRRGDDSCARVRFRPNSNSQ